MRKLFFAPLSVFFLLGLLLQEGHSAAADKPKYGGTLRIGLRKDITTLNPFINHLSVDDWVRSLVYEGLTDLNKNLDVVPSLAESWRMSKDGKEYTFHLRKGVLFHNGKKMDAEDVKWSLEYILEPKNRAYLHSAINVIDKIDLIDQSSLKITLKEPFTPLLTIGLSGDTVIIPKNSVSPGETPTVAPPGTGPFQLAEWKRDNEIRQVANKNYWRKGTPHLDEVVFKPIPSSDVRFISLRSGDLDFIEELPYAAVDDIKNGKYPNVKFAPAPFAMVRIIKMNVEAPYFKDPRIRRAVGLAIDRKNFIDGTAFGHGEPTYQVYPKGFKWHFDDVKNPEMNLEKAKALLGEAGYPDGFKSRLQVTQGQESDGVMIQSQLKRIGIDLEIQSLHAAEYRKVIVDGTFDILTSGSKVYPDIDGDLHKNFHSETGFKRVGNNTGYKNPEVDKLLDVARTVSDFTKRRELYKRATEILLNDSPQVNIAFIPRFFGYRSHVKGFSTNFEGALSFVEGGIPLTWVERDQK